MDEHEGIIYQRIWKVPRTKQNPYGYKYSLSYARVGERILCYDNGENKSPHIHYRNKERPYDFKDIWTLIEDFSRDLERVRRGEI